MGLDVGSSAAAKLDASSIRARRVGGGPSEDVRSLPPGHQHCGQQFCEFVASRIRRSASSYWRRCSSAASLAARSAASDAGFKHLL